MIFETLHTSGHEQVVFCNNSDAGLKAVIAIHSTVLGPALGGVRMRPYASGEDALTDALRLSRTMTYKNALAGLNVGGGKAVLIGDASRDKTEAMFRAFGRYVDSLGGRYITAEDVGTDVNDMEQVYRETEYVVGVHQVHGGSGDSAPFTAYGALLWLIWVAGLTGVFSLAVVALLLPKAIAVVGAIVAHITRPSEDPEAPSPRRGVLEVSLERGLRAALIVGAALWLAQA